MAERVTRCKAEKRAAFAAADAALAASGTVSLELAAADTPMVIGYDANWLTKKIVKRLLMVDTVTLVNLVSETRVVPEFLGDALPSGAAGGGGSGRAAKPETQQRNAMRVTMERLGSRTGSARLAGGTRFGAGRVGRGALKRRSAGSEHLAVFRQEQVAPLDQPRRCASRQAPPPAGSTGRHVRPSGTRSGALRHGP